jgi:large subunit ribosomal protein L3
MTHVFLIEERRGTPDYGKEIIQATTVMETPPLLVCAVRAYVRNNQGLQTLVDTLMNNPVKDLKRVLTLPNKSDQKNNFVKMEEKMDDITEFRILTATQPRKTSVSKKKPDLTEIKIGGGSIKEQFEYVKQLLGNSVSVSEVLKEGQFVDAVAVTKGKGFQGPVKRWGIKILPRKSRKTKRGVAAIGPWRPARVLYTVPRAGQMGYFQRTEYNKLILKIVHEGEEFSLKGGFLRYGSAKGNYVLIEGSLPGPAKRLVRLRYAARPPKKAIEAPPRITHISLESPQGK